MKNQLSITVDTTNTTVLSELSLMFSRLAGTHTLGEKVAYLDATPPTFNSAPLGEAYTPTVHENHENEEEANAAWEAVNADPYAQVGTPTETIDPSVAFGGSVPPPPLCEEDILEAAAQGTPPSPATVELDSAGMPWDARIHSAAKTKVANGTWKLLRGVDQELVKAVKAEYLGNDVSTPMPNNEPTVKPPVEDMTKREVTVVPPPPSAPAPVVGGMSYDQAIEHLISVKKVPVHVIQARCIANGVATFPMLSNPENAHLIDTIVQESVVANEKRLLEAGSSNG